ncbi:aminotransferase class I/II-fold pyridoxal phosphate-dependent enzyme [Nocardioides jiangxiensis]|uniref:8-amino-7-oxononanoate synthase n=1 Tax=Nocardioides jiangxiensis TaxID=3064524 RepID=A0ABT9AWH1_9ACTN|nr:aminotransferase class I/II-fold pyridoxal phosphate-dependent enzyme [Nocardioides sp. WY-20]MDO7866771.1 aminotransferase class I/II-fold pyridoxal phosphate-dependent enzyme [Nocardioides sp. WY-20]
MPDVDLTSGHFLGLRPAAVAAGPLTTGRPAVVGEPALHTHVAARLARTVGVADAVLARSSLHALIDALSTAPSGAALLVDEAIYPVGRWAADAAVGSGTCEGGTVLTFRHQDVRDAARVARRAGRPVVVVTDGLCGSCLRPAPLADLAAVAARHGGHLVVDDSLAAGLGPGGAGTAGWLAPAPERMLVAASLAKGYAAPVAAVLGPADLVTRLRRDGPTRTHSSPASACDVDALRQALADPTTPGRRRRLGSHVQRVRSTFVRLGLAPLGVPFAVVCTEGGRVDPLELQRRLASLGVRTLATRGRCTGRPTLTLCLRADLGPGELDRLDRALTRAVGEVAA